MPAKITGIKFKNEFRSENVDYLLGNIGDKINIEIDVEFEEIIVPSVDEPIIYRNTNGYTGTTVSEGWLTDESNRFTNVKVGDVLRRWDYDLNLFSALHTVLYKKDDGALFIDNTGGANNQIVTYFAFSVITPITSIRYKWNFIENNGNVTFNSLVDGSQQEAITENKLATDLTATPLTMIGENSYQIGYATIQGLGIAGGTTYYRSQYRIIHQTFITPFMLTEDFANLVNGIAPNYYLNDSCLKAIFNIIGLYNFNDENRVQEIETSETIGNSGWFNENFNNRVTKYSASVVYKRPDTSVIPSIELVTTETTVEITVNNTGDSPFSNNNTKFTLNFAIAPTDAANYQNNGRLMYQNFCFDRTLQTVGSAAINGDNFGGDYQVLKDVSATFINATQIKITAKIAMAANVISILQENNEYRYILWVATQNHTLETKLADKVALLIDAENFYQDVSDPGMIVPTLKVLRHPFELQAELDNSADIMPEDEIVSWGSFYIDRNGRLTDEIIINNVSTIIKAKNSSTLDEFNLETFLFDANGLPFVGLTQFVDNTQSRPFHIPNAEPRKNIVFKRRVDLDNANKYYFDFRYPFLNRWEYWQKLEGVNSAFFDVGQPNNNFNNFWHRYSLLANWGIFIELKINATKNGEPLVYRQELNLPSFGYNSNPDWTAESIKSYDNSNNELISGGNKFINGYEDTKIEAKFTKTTSFLLANIFVVFGIEVYEQGGIFGRRRYSSKWVTTDDTWFKSISGNGLVSLQQTGNTVTATVLIDKSLLPVNSKYKVTARLYDLTLTGKLFQDSEAFEFQDGDNYEFQDGL